LLIYTTRILRIVSVLGAAQKSQKLRTGKGSAIPMESILLEMIELSGQTVGEIST
jgi:hypothetical protein